MSYAIVSIIRGYTCSYLETIIDRVVEDLPEEICEAMAEEWYELLEGLITTEYSASGNADDVAHYIGVGLTDLDSYKTISVKDLTDKIKFAEDNLSSEKIAKLASLISAVEALPDELKRHMNLSEMDTWVVWSDS